MRKALIAIYALLLAAFVALALLAAQPEPIPGDRTVLDLIREATASVAHDALHAISHTGSAIPAGITVALMVGLMLVIRRPDAAILVAAVPTITWAATSGLKVLIDRARPEVQLTIGGTSFPSGHTSYATALGGVIFLLAPSVVRNRALARAVQGAAGLFIILMGLSRVAMAAHWPSDVVGGFLLGVLLLVPAAALYRRRVRAGTEPPEMEDA